MSASSRADGVIGQNPVERTSGRSSLGERREPPAVTERNAVKYALLIYSEPWSGAPPSPEEAEANMAKWYEYTNAMQEAGVMLAGEALQDIGTATSVRLRGGEVTTTDGPFAETKEVLTGFYLLEIDTLDDAIAWAARCPAAVSGTIELRPLVVLD
jgi:hypothetical protein